jgi:hypothetical protein
MLEKVAFYIDFFSMVDVNRVEYIIFLFNSIQWQTRYSMTLNIARLNILQILIIKLRQERLAHMHLPILQK